MASKYLGSTALAALIEKVKSAIADAATKIKAEHVTFDDGETFQYKLDQGTLKGDKGDAGKDGAPGAAGKDGAPGAAAGFGDVTATVDSGVGEPSVEVEPGGPDTAKTFTFTFHNLKGDKGDPGTPAENMEELSAEDVETAWSSD